MVSILQRSALRAMRTRCINVSEWTDSTLILLVTCHKNLTHWATVSTIHAFFHCHRIGTWSNNELLQFSILILTYLTHSIASWKYGVTPISSEGSQGCYDETSSSSSVGVSHASLQLTDSRLYNTHHCSSASFCISYVLVGATFTEVTGVLLLLWVYWAWTH